MTIGWRSFVNKHVKACAWPRTAVVLPQIQAHRGYTGYGAIENSIEAFQAANSVGFQMSECDIQLSSDGKPVVYHDQTLLRLHSDANKISDLTAKELRDRFQIPTLESLFVDTKVTPLFNLELKSKNIFGDDLEKTVCEIVEKYRFQGRVVFSSFNPFSLIRLKKYLPDVPRSLLVTKAEDPENHFLLKNMVLAPLIDFHMLNLDLETFHSSEIIFWKDQKIPISMWTIKTDSQFQSMKSLKVNSIITDLFSESYLN